MKKYGSNWSRPSEFVFKRRCENSQLVRRQVMLVDGWNKFLRHPRKSAKRFTDSLLLSESAAGMLLSGDSGT